MRVKIQKLDPAAKVPTYGTLGSACFDLATVDEAIISTGAPAVLRTGLAFEIPADHVMLVFSRSGHGFKSNVRLSNCVGVIDSDYRGEVAVKLTGDKLGNLLSVQPGDRVAQAMILPVEQVDFEVVDSLSQAARGSGGFGSTGS